MEPDGTVMCFRYGVLHRDDGPAIIKAGGGEFWYYQFGKLHREDGPAVIRADGMKEYWLNGEPCP